MKVIHFVFIPLFTFFILHSFHVFSQKHEIGVSTGYVYTSAKYDFFTYEYENLSDAYERAPTVRFDYKYYLIENFFISTGISYDERRLDLLYRERRQILSPKRIQYTYYECAFAYGTITIPIMVGYTGRKKVKPIYYLGLGVSYSTGVRVIEGKHNIAPEFHGEEGSHSYAGIAGIGIQTALKNNLNVHATADYQTHILEPSGYYNHFKRMGIIIGIRYQFNTLSN